MKGHSSTVNTVAVTTDNKFVISGSGNYGESDNTIRIWNLIQKTQETVFPGHSKEVISVAVTSDNKCVISGSEDNTIRI